MDLRNLPDIAQPRILGCGLDEPPVDAGDAHGLAALHLQEVDQALVDFACQDHLYDVGGLLIGHAQAVHELGFLAHFGHKVRDLRSASVHQHDLHAHQGQEDDVAHDLLFEVLVDHRVAAVFYDDHFVVIILYIGECFGQYLGPLCVTDHLFSLMSGSRR